MSKFVLNIYHSKLKEHIANKLADKNKSEIYLTNLYQVISLLLILIFLRAATHIHLI